MRKPYTQDEITEKGLYEWTKKLGQQHFHKLGSSETLCDMPMLGNNYAGHITGDDLRPCEKCYAIADKRKVQSPKYYHTSWTVYDGEHEYKLGAVFTAKGLAQAKRIAVKDYCAAGYKGDYRGYSSDGVEEITKEQYDILERFI